MTSTLPRRPTDQLKDALGRNYVRETVFTSENALQFRKNAASYIQDAKNEALTPISRYTLAYEAVHALAVGFLYLHELAPSNNEGHRTQALTILYTHLELDRDDRSEMTHAHKQRNDKLYKSPAPPVGRAAAQSLAELAVRVEQVACEKLADWYAL